MVVPRGGCVRCGELQGEVDLLLRLWVLTRLVRGTLCGGYGFEGWRL